MTWEFWSIAGLLGVGEGVGAATTAAVGEGLAPASDFVLIGRLPFLQPLKTSPQSSKMIVKRLRMKLSVAIKCERGKHKQFSL